MSAWNSNLSWCFSPLGAGNKVGVNDAGIGIFKKRPYIGLAKEILQNVLDAKDPAIKGPARACFEIISIGQEDLPGRERLSEVIKRCYDYYHDGDDGIKMGMIRDAAEKYLDSSATIPVLKISDYNTIGLTGTHAEKGTNWTGLVREVGATNKSHGSSGSFGVGKFAPYNFSAIRTLIYSTKNKDGETALQGKTILTTFRDNDGKLKQNIGLFGFEEDDDSKAVFNFNDVPEVFRRESTGTDIYILGAKKDPDWIHQTAISVLDFFFYAIFMNDLEVVIRENDQEVLIRKDKLPDLIDWYTEYCKDKEIEFDAPVFWEVLQNTSGKTKKFTTTIRNKGEVELYLMLDSDFYDRRIMEMRKAGMKIQEDTGFRIGAYFHGIFIATGAGSKSDEPEDNINSFLRKCENQAHDTWSKDEYEENKEEADKVIKEIHAWILEQVKSLMPKEEAEETDAYGLSDLLPNQFGSGGEEQQEEAYANYEPLPIDIASVTVKSGNKKISDISVEVKNPEKAEAEIIVPDENGEDSTPGGIQPGEQHKPHPPYPGPFPGPFPGPEPTPDPQPFPEGPEQIPGTRTPDKEKTGTGKTTFHRVPITNIKTPFDINSNTFIVSFVPQKDCADVYIRLQIGSDDEDKRTAEVKTASENGEKLDLYSGFIKYSAFEKGKKVILRVELSNARRVPLEVNAYVK